MSEFPITFSALKSFSLPKAAAGQASRQAGRHAGQHWQQQSSHYLLIAVVQMSFIVVFRRRLSSSMRMRCQTKDRGWNFDDDAERGNTSDAAEISEGSGGAAHMGDMT